MMVWLGLLPIFVTAIVVLLKWRKMVNENYNHPELKVKFPHQPLLYPASYCNEPLLYKHGIIHGSGNSISIHNGDITGAMLSYGGDGGSKTCVNIAAPDDLGTGHVNWAGGSWHVGDKFSHSNCRSVIKDKLIEPVEPFKFKEGISKKVG